MPLLDSTFSTMLGGLGLSRSRSPAPAKKPTRSRTLSRSSREPPLIEVRRPSEEERAFRGNAYAQSTASSSSVVSLASSTSSMGRLSSSRASPLSPHHASMGFGRQSRRRMGNLAPKPLPTHALRLSRSTSELSAALSSSASITSSRQSEDLVSFLNFDSDSDGSDDEGQDLLVSASVSSAASSLGALTPPNFASILEDSDKSVPNVRNRYQDPEDDPLTDADYIYDAISSHVSLDEADDACDHFTSSRSGTPSTAAQASPRSPVSVYDYSLTAAASSSPRSFAQTEYVSPTSVSPNPSPNFASPTRSFVPDLPVSPRRNGLDRALTEDEERGLIPIAFDESRRPSEVSLASVSSAVSDATIDCRTGEPRRKSSVYDAMYFEKVISPALDQFPTPPASTSSTLFITPSMTRSLSIVEEADEPSTPTNADNPPSIDALLALVACIDSPTSPSSKSRTRTPPPPAPTKELPPLPNADTSPYHVTLSAEAPAPSRRAPPAPLRFSNAKLQTSTRNNPLRRAPSILSPGPPPSFSSSPANSSVLSSLFDLNTPFSGSYEDDFLEADSPLFEHGMGMKMGGLEDINEEEGPTSPTYFSLEPVSPRTAQREEVMWNQVTRGLTARSRSPGAF